MTTAFQSIAQAYKAALEAAPALTGVAVRANPTSLVERDASSGIAVRTGSSRVFDSSPCADAWETEYTFDITGRASHGSDPALAVDALLAAVYAVLSTLDLSAMSVQDVMGVEPSIERDYDASDTPQAGAALRITTRHFTERFGLTASAP
jgi:metal-dependent amidase/aminoacylase/carboxypeptidase family protein